MKTAFIFPGQGAQTVGMGADVAQAYPVAAALFDKANAILGFDLKTIGFEGPAEKLNSTTMSQPAIFVTSAALLEILRTSPATANVKPDVTAGLSMGEYTALYAAGAISFEDGLRLVRKRGEAMQAAADATQGTMVSIIGLDEDKVRRLCDEARQRLCEGVGTGPHAWSSQGRPTRGGRRVPHEPDGRRRRGAASGAAPDADLAARSGADDREHQRGVLPNGR